MKTLYVHAGTPKTGTTAIQKFCMANRGLLKSKGYVYPDFRDITELARRNVTPSRNGCFLTSRCWSKDDAREMFRRGMDRVIENFEKYDNVILSDEAIYANTIERRKTLWRELLEEGEKGGFDVRMIVYLRRQDEFFPSFWNQLVKKERDKRGCLTWEEYWHDPARIKECGLDYDVHLAAIERELGIERMTVRRYDRDRFYGGSIFADFLQAVGLELDDSYKIPDSERSRNEKLAGNMHEIKRIVNGMKPDIDMKANHFYREALLHASALPGVDRPYGMFSKEEAEGFLERYREGNRRVAERYFGESGDLFSMEVKDLPKWQKDNPDMIDDVVRYTTMVAEALRQENIELREKLESQDERLKRQEKELERLKEEVDKPLKVRLKRKASKVLKSVREKRKDKGGGDDGNASGVKANAGNAGGSGNASSGVKTSDGDANGGNANGNVKNGSDGKN